MCLILLTQSTLNTEPVQTVDDFVIIDCRYPFEYEGGHIEGAYNLWTMPLLESFLLEKNISQLVRLAAVLAAVLCGMAGDAVKRVASPPHCLALLCPNRGDTQADDGRTVLIFHCEFSSHRAPQALKWIRNLDRRSASVHRGWGWGGGLSTQCLEHDDPPSLLAAWPARCMACSLHGRACVRSRGGKGSGRLLSSAASSAAATPSLSCSASALHPSLHGCAVAFAAST